MTGVGQWDATAPGVFRLPSGRLVRGRSLRAPLPTGPTPEFGLYLRWSPLHPPWEHRWLRWADFWLPAEPAAASAAFTEVLRRCTHQRVEVACPGGVGRTGTALACLAVLDGIAGSDAVAYVRVGYHARAVETPWQRRFVLNTGRARD